MNDHDSAKQDHRDVCDSEPKPGGAAATADLVADTLENVSRLTADIVRDAHRVAASWSALHALVVGAVARGGLETAARVARGVADTLKPAPRATEKNPS